MNNLVYLIYMNVSVLDIGNRERGEEEIRRRQQKKSNEESTCVGQGDI